jgi:hypothetical protein
MKNARNLGLRLDQITADRLSSFEDATKIEGVTLARAALEAALDAFQSTGKISFPLTIQIASAAQEFPAYLREDDIKYPVPQASGKKRVS